MEEVVEIPAMKREWNVNTVLAVITLLGIIAGGGGAWSSVQSTLKEQADDIAELKTIVDKATTAYQTDTGAVRQRFAEMELRMGEIPLLKQQQAQTDANMNNINQRIDRQFSEMNDNFKETRDAVNKVATQVEVLTQILQRMEQTSRAAPRSEPRGGN